jgi:hypothetical protein
MLAILKSHPAQRNPSVSNRVRQIEIGFLAIVDICPNVTVPMNLPGSLIDFVQGLKKHLTIK